MSPESSTSPVVRGDVRDRVLGVRRQETEWLSNPAALFPDGEATKEFTRNSDEVGRPTGTVNLVAVVDHALSAGALANLIAVTAGFRARYDDQDPPASVADAEHGVVTDLEAEVSPP